MTSVVDTDQARSVRPIRCVTSASPWGRRGSAQGGKGWMSAAGELAMTAADLARWDIAVMNRTVLKPSSYGELEREVLLASGAPTGLRPRRQRGGDGWPPPDLHGGEVSGFTARNEIYPG
jgi:CubicO group peptidase (beta-lactamase class C family)